MPRRTLLSVFGFAVLLAVGPGSSQDPKPSVTVDKDKKTVTIDAKVAPRKLPNLDQVYPIEVIATFPFREGKKGKAHETVVVTDVTPSEVHKALETLGLKPGKPAKGEGAKADGPEVNVYIEVPQPGGSP